MEFAKGFKIMKEKKVLVCERSLSEGFEFSD